MIAEADRAKQSKARRAHLMFKSLDMFGRAVSLNFNGEDTFKTSIGAAVTVGIFIIMFNYAIPQIYQTVKRESP